MNLEKKCATHLNIFFGINWSIMSGSNEAFCERANQSGSLVTEPRPWRPRGDISNRVPRGVSSTQGRMQGEKMDESRMNGARKTEKTDGKTQPSG